MFRGRWWREGAVGEGTRRCLVPAPAPSRPPAGDPCPNPAPEGPPSSVLSGHPGHSSCFVYNNKFFNICVFGSDKSQLRDLVP